jgi:multidrug efflux pump subunit AcrA (membrane-fusion protein)
MDRPRLAGPIALGVCVIVLFFGGFGAWSTLTPLSAAAIAPGKVIVETSRKTVRHLEGGIVAKISIREGDRVARGQVLLELDQTRARANMALLTGQTDANEKQLRLLNQQLTSQQQLLKEGFGRKNDLLALQRRQAELEGNRKKLLAQMLAARDVLARSIIRAANNGTVVGLKVHTIGGVIKPGDDLMSIVPRDDALIIEAQVDPLDRDVIKAGLSALIRLTPYNQRGRAPLKGRVVSVSADNVLDARTKREVFLARITLTGGVPEDMRIYPGMPAEVMILTGERTLFDMLLEPLAKSMRRAFRG